MTEPKTSEMLRALLREFDAGHFTDDEVAFHALHRLLAPMVERARAGEEATYASSVCGPHNALSSLRLEYDAYRVTVFSAPKEHKALRDCGDCGAKPGELHERGCDVERCALCGGQQICCECIYTVNGLSDLEEQHPDIYKNGATDAMWAKFDEVVEETGGRLPWTGEFPGCAECREHDMWCYWGPDYGEEGWVKCGRGHPGAREDLSELFMRTDWDPKLRRYVLRKKGS